MDNLQLVFQLLLDEKEKAKMQKGLKDTATSIDSVGDAEEKLNENQDKIAKDTRKRIEEEIALRKGLVQKINAFNGQAYYVTKEWMEKEKKLASDPAYIQKIAEERNKRFAQSYEEHKQNLKAIEAEKKALKEKNSPKQAQANEEDRKKGREYFDQLTRASEGLREAERKRHNDIQKAAIKEEADAKNIAKAQALITQEYRRQVQESSRLRQTSEKLGMAGRGLLYTGTAIVGGAFALANQEAKRQKSDSDSGQGTMTVATQKWLAATVSIEESTRRIAKSYQAIILPYLERAASVAERASRFIENNPQIAKAVLSAGAIAAVIGSTLVLASKGIRMVADIKYLAANAEFDLATRRFEASVLAFKTSGKDILNPRALLSKGTSALGLGGGTAGAAAGLSIAGTVAAVLAVLASGATLGTIVYDIMAKKFGLTRVNVIATGGANIVGKQFEKVDTFLGGDAKEAERKTLVFTALIGKWTGALKDGDPILEKARASVKKINSAFDEVADTAGRAAQEADGWKVFRNLQLENIDAERQYLHERGKIIEDTNRSLAEAARKSAQNSKKIRDNLAESINKITTSFTDDALKSEQSYQLDRAKIVQQGGEEIKRIEQDTQEQLRELAKEHNQKVTDLTIARDAFGLVREMQDYEDKRKEIESSKNKEIAQRRRDLAIELSDLANAHARERAEKLEKYKKDILEAREQAKKQLIENAANLAEERRQLLVSRNEKLKDLNYSYQEERRQRIQAAQAQIRDIGTNLAAERALKQLYYKSMLADTTTWVNSMKSLMSSATKLGTKTSAGGVPKFAAGGYVPSGLIESHAGEFMLTDKTVSILEGAVKGNLTQRAVQQAVGGTSITWNDHRSFSGEYTPSMKKEVEKDTLNLIDDLLRK